MESTASLSFAKERLWPREKDEPANQSGKRIETRHNEKMDGTITNNVTTTYYLRSSVLGGVSVAEIDSSGQRAGHVYVGGEKIADYNGWAPYSSLSFRQVNPTTRQLDHDAVACPRRTD
jgi:hypothetical protein